MKKSIAPLIREMELWATPELFRGKPAIVLRKRITNPAEMKQIIDHALMQKKDLKVNIAFLDPFKVKAKLKEIGYL